MDVTTSLLDIQGHFTLRLSQNPCVRQPKFYPSERLKHFLRICFFVESASFPWRGLKFTLSFIQLKFKIVSSAADMKRCPRKTETVTLERLHLSMTRLGRPSLGLNITQLWALSCRRMDEKAVIGKKKKKIRLCYITWEKKKFQSISLRFPGYV